MRHYLCVSTEVRVFVCSNSSVEGPDCQVDCTYEEQKTIVLNFKVASIKLRVVEIIFGRKIIVCS